MATRAPAQRMDGRVSGSVRCLISVIDGPTFKGVASNLSPNGLYIEVAGELLPGRDAEVDIFLRESRNTPDLHLRGSIARRTTSAEETREGHVGVGVLIREAPAEYHALFSDADKTQEEQRSHAPYPLVAYDGSSLDDIFEMLEGMGAQPRRAYVKGPQALEGWTDIPKLLLVDATDALTLEMPEEADRQGVLRVAIASSQSEVLGRLLRRLGYQYLIRRPVHRDAIEILLRNLLHQGQSRRASPRVALGVDAEIQARPWGWARACSLLDLSRGGCLVTSRWKLSLRKKVKLVVGSNVTGDKELVLTAHVIRRRYDDASNEWQSALRFHPAADVQGMRLGQLLRRTALGPSKPLEPTGIQRLGSLGRKFLGLGRKLIPLPGHPDRRRDARARFDRHVCKLDESGTRVTALLAGYDLTAQGMRVQPHPELELGSHFALSLHDHTRQRPIEVSAEVVRDDGSDGLALRFIDLDTDLSGRIEALVSALPEAHSLVMAGIESSIENIEPR